MGGDGDKKKVRYVHLHWRDHHALETWLLQERDRLIAERPIFQQVAEQATAALNAGRSADVPKVEVAYAHVCSHLNHLKIKWKKRIVNKPAPRPKAPPAAAPQPALPFDRSPSDKLALKLSEVTEAHNRLASEHMKLCAWVRKLSLDLGVPAFDLPPALEGLQ